VTNNTSSLGCVRLCQLASRCRGQPVDIIARCITLWLVAATLLCCPGAGFGQTTSVDREVKAARGCIVRVGIYTSMRTDCTAGPLPAIRFAVAPSYGTVIVRRATLKATNVKQWLAAELPAFVAFYRAGQDFNCDDRFELEVSFAAGRKQIQRFHVTIASGANEGQHI
jgi:hypothetical protein